MAYSHAVILFRNGFTRMTKRSFLRTAALLLPAAILLGLGLHFSAFLLRPVTPSSEVVLTVAPGSALKRVAAQLQEQGVIGNARYFVLLARAKSLASHIQAGDYRFREAAQPAQVLRRLVEGDVVQLSLTVPEGLSLREIAPLVEGEGFGNARRFLDLAHDGDFIASLGIEADSLEGYLFPETYSFAKGTGEEQVLRAMADEMRRRLTPELLEAAAEQGLDRHQLLTLASIIQKEAGRIDEMPLISAVYHNRLRRGMRLQADPTVIYGIENFNGNLTRRDLEEMTPYNTYRRKGLPPGPIASPGADALRAAAAPADSDALYFVSRGDGSHVFSRTLAEHNRAVRRYQLHR